MPRTMDGLHQAMIYLEIIRCLNKYSKTTPEQILNMLESRGIHIRLLTLQRYLKQLSECDHPYIERDNRSRPYGYRFSPQASVFARELNPRESLLMQLVKEHLQYQLPASVFESFEGLFCSANETLSSTKGRTSKEGRWVNKVAIVANTLPQMPPPIKGRIFKEVSEALYENKKLEIQYENSEGKRKKYVVNPLGIVQQEPRLYLVCQFDGYDNIRHIALHRIGSAKKLDDNASTVPGFNIGEYVKSQHFNYTGDTVRRVHLSFDFTNPVTKRNLEESPFNRGQTIEEKVNGLYHLEVDIEDSLLLDGWLRTWEKIAGITNLQKEPID
ncbi:MAG TPA: WYL domain-containing protein [Candidatus Aphodousia gallistercoris]|nr:WYL domain-containing protein [Candidatus Aphodousia gallistercoris]